MLYAVDIPGEAAVLLTHGPQGWEQCEEMTPTTATPEAIAKAGGPVKFVWSLLESINRALRILQGKPREGDIPKPQDPTTQGEVLAFMNSSVVPHTLMDGTVQLRVK